MVIASTAVSLCLSLTDVSTRSVSFCVLEEPEQPASKTAKTTGIHFRNIFLQDM